MMTMNAKKIGITFMIVVSLLSMLMSSVTVSAEEDKTLILVCRKDDNVLAGVQWKLYKVGVRTSDEWNFTMTGDFEDNQLNMRNLTEERVNLVAQSLQVYAVSEGIKPLQEAVSDVNGEVIFSGLDCGLYLVTGKTYKVGYNYYVPTTMLLEVKSTDSSVKYDAFPKFSYQVMNEESRNYTMRKVWEDDGTERPSQVIIELYKNDEFERSVILSEENDWRFRWTDDSPDALWIAAEKYVPEGYEMRTDFNSQQYLIQNTYYDDAKPVPESKKDYVMTTTYVHTPSVTTTTQANIVGSDDESTHTTTNMKQNESTDTTTVNNISGGEGEKTRTTTTTFDVKNGETEKTKTTVSATESETVYGGESTTQSVSTDKTESFNSGNGNGSDGGNGNSAGKLPQTSQLWWPVLPLSVGGVLMLSAGLVIRSKCKYECDYREEQSL